MKELKLANPKKYKQERFSSEVVSSKDCNPAEKVPTPVQEAELQSLLAGFHERRLALLVANGELTQAALLRAVERGQVESYIQNPPAAGGTAGVAYVKEQQALMKEHMAVLEQRLGTSLRDWAWSSMTSSKPDGIPRQNIIWFSRRDEPQVFVKRDEIGRLDKEETQALRDFFARM